jgi:hypothetical protein
MVVPAVRSVSFSLSRAVLGGRYRAAVIPLSTFPAPEEELAVVRGFLGNLVRLLVDRHHGSLDTFLQLTQLHLGDGSQRVSAHGREWMPSMGLGVWPDRDAPHGWTNDELQSLVPGETLRPMMDIVLRVGVQNKGNDARDVMLGLGTVLQFVVSDPDQFLRAARALLWPPIKDPSYTAFPFYVPLFELRAVSGASESDLEKWLCGARAVIRESPEDSGILIVSDESLDAALRQAGAAPVEGSTDDWAVRVQSAVASV